MIRELVQIEILWLWSSDYKEGTRGLGWQGELASHGKGQECLLESGSYCTAAQGPESLVFRKTLRPATLLTVPLHDVNLCEYYVSVS